MTALPSPLQNQQGSNAAADPSMEEILASIRRIIADDNGAPLTPRPSKAAPVIDSKASESQVVQPLSASRMETPRPRFSSDPLLYAQPRHVQMEAAPVVDAKPLRAADDAGVLGERVARLEAEPLRSRPVLRHSFDESREQDIEARPSASSLVEVKSAKSAEAESGAAAVDALLSPLTRASVTSAFEALTVSMSVQNTSMVEDAVRDMLKPMLKDWLDNNLPTIVERLVRTEIERVARGGRS